MRSVIFYSFARLLLLRFLRTFDRPADMRVTGSVRAKIHGQEREACTALHDFVLAKTASDHMRSEERDRFACSYCMLSVRERRIPEGSRLPCRDDYDGHHFCAFHAFDCVCYQVHWWASPGQFLHPALGKRVHSACLGRLSVREKSLGFRVRRVREQVDRWVPFFCQSSVARLVDTPIAGSNSLEPSSAHWIL